MSSTRKNNTDSDSTKSTLQTSTTTSTKTSNTTTTVYIVYGNSLHHIYAEDWINAFSSPTTNSSSRNNNIHNHKFEVKLVGPQ